MDPIDFKELKRRKKKIPFFGKTLMLFLFVALVDALLAYMHIGVLYQYVLNK